MYNDISSASTLAATGGGIAAGSMGLWWLLAAFAMIAVGSAVMRIVPRRKH
uniref:Peptidase n=2 Tax=unclassified bacterial viruses TaxID=12333 RepID=A0AAU7J7U0_9VIRU